MTARRAHSTIIFLLRHAAAAGVRTAVCIRTNGPTRTTMLNHTKEIHHSFLRKTHPHQTCSPLFSCLPAIMPLRPPSSRMYSSGYSQTWSTRTLPHAARRRPRGSRFQALSLDPGSGPALTGGRPQSLSSCAALPNKTAGGSSPFHWSVPAVDTALRSLSALPPGTEEASTVPP